MKSFTNLNPSSLELAIEMAQQARSNGQSFAFSGGGTDLLQQIKDEAVKPDVLINLRSVTGSNAVTENAQGLNIGGLITLDTLANHAVINTQFTALAQAAQVVGSPQIRNVATLAGNITQRPWCWYYRNGFRCYKAGGNECFSVTGENQLNAIFGGGPSYIVHPSDLAPALVALGASFEVRGPAGTQSRSAEEFFILPSVNPARENVLSDEELLAAVNVPTPRPGVRSTYLKLMDREAWTHAVVSVAVVLEMNAAQCISARIVLGGVAPTPWRLPQVEQMLAGQTVTAELARTAGEAAIANAQPLAKNAYKLPITSALVERAILSLVNA